jgi:G3E family GTPase
VIASLRARLKAINPNASISDVRDAGAALLSAGLYDPATKTADVRRWLGEAADPHDHSHGHDDHHHHRDHDHHHGHDEHDHHGRHDSRIKSHTLVHDRPLPFSAVETFIDILRSAHGERLLRMKGIIELAEDPSRPLVVHGVQTLFHPPARLPAWPDTQRGTRIVLITIDMPEDYVRRLFAAIAGTPSIDTPDRAAVVDNPLAIAGFRR